MFDKILFGFNDEMEKQADLISKELFNRLDEYKQEKLVGIRDTIAEATKKGTKIQRSVREKMIEAAADDLKSMAWGLTRTSKDQDMPQEAKPAPKKKLTL